MNKFPNKKSVVVGMKLVTLLLYSLPFAYSGRLGKGVIRFQESERIRENVGAADIGLTAQEVAAIDEKLNHMEMSAV